MHTLLHLEEPLTFHENTMAIMECQNASPDFGNIVTLITIVITGVIIIIIIIIITL